MDDDDEKKLAQESLRSFVDIMSEILGTRILHQSNLCLERETIDIESFFHARWGV